MKEKVVGEGSILWNYFKLWFEFCLCCPKGQAPKTCDLCASDMKELSSPCPGSDTNTMAHLTPPLATSASHSLAVLGHALPGAASCSACQHCFLWPRGWVRRRRLSEELYFAACFPRCCDQGVKPCMGNLTVWEKKNLRFLGLQYKHQRG